MKSVLSWSGGKECAMALYAMREVASTQISALLTTVSEENDRVSMHGVRRALIEKQAESLGIPLIIIAIPKECPQVRYSAIMEKEMEKLRGRGVSSVIFGDLFLQDVRRYREKNLERAGMRALFPLWLRNTAELAEEFVERGFRAVVTCVDSGAMDARFAGRMLDRAFLDELPPGVDPCGENGEFHSFVFDGPIFKEGVPFARGETVRRGRLYFHDLLPACPN